MLTNTLQIALLIDGDNAQPTLIPHILKAVKNYGDLVIQRVYGDWSASNLAKWHEIETAHTIQMVQQSRYTKGKNVTDIALVISAMDILISEKINAFCIVSSDSDFTPLAIRLKDAGMTVIGVGKKITPVPFVNACTTFIFTETLIDAPPKVNVPPQKANPKTPSSAKPPKVLGILKQAFAAATKKDGWVLLGELGQRIHKIAPDFKPKTYGKKGLSQLVSQFEGTFEIRKDKGNASNMYLKLRK